MFVYDKKLQYPVKIKNPNPALAKFIISQYGGPDGELGASLRYLSQRYSMPYPELRAVLTDIGTNVRKQHLYQADKLTYQQPISLTPLDSFYFSRGIFCHIGVIFINIIRIRSASYALHIFMHGKIVMRYLDYANCNI